MLTEQELHAGLHTTRLGRKIYSFATIDSTNNCARALGGCFAEEGTVVIAEQQSAGRGRLGRVWTSTPGENLMFSVLLRPRMPLESVQLLPLAAGVAVARAVRAVAQVEPTCKWPNDILVGDRKLAGMLLEASAQQDGVDFVVLGIGINVNQTVFPAEIAHTATSLRNETGVAVERVRLFREVLTAFESLYLHLAAEGPDAVLPPWLELCPSVGTELEVDLRGTMVQGTMDGVGRDGALLLRTAEGQRAFYAGDVTIRKTVHHAPGN